MQAVFTLRRKSPEIKNKSGVPVGFSCFFDNAQAGPQNDIDHPAPIGFVNVLVPTAEGDQFVEGQLYTLSITKTLR